MQIKKKIVNFLTTQGKKTINEKNFCKTVKTLQKKSKKSTKDLIKLTIINTLIPFKILTFKRKKRKKKQTKEFPFFIKNYKNQIFFTIKSLIESVKKNKQKNSCSENLQKEFLLPTTKFSNSIKIKSNIQKFFKNNNRLVTYYKW